MLAEHVPEPARAMLGNKERRTHLIAACSLCLNLAYAAYNAALGFVMRPAWYLTMAAYYACLALMRFGVVSYERMHTVESDPLGAGEGGLTSAEGAGGRSHDKDPPLVLRREVTETAVMRTVGTVLLVMVLFLSGIITYSTKVEVATNKGTVHMIAIATYTFVKVPLAIVSLVRTGSQGQSGLRMLRSISLADAAVSVLSLQRSMLATFGSMGTEGVRMMNRATGAGVCLVVATLGVRLLLAARKVGRSAKAADVENAGGAGDASAADCAVDGAGDGGTDAFTGDAMRAPLQTQQVPPS